MDLLSASVEVLRDAWLQAGKQAILEGIAHLKTRPTFLFAIADRPWLFDFLIFRPDRRFTEDALTNWLASQFCQGQLTEQEIGQWIEEALAEVPLCPLPQLPAPSDFDLWCAVSIDGKLFCCGCRSLYEGEQLSESQVAALRDELACTLCEDCGINR